MQIGLNGVQVRALVEVLREYADGEEIVITEQPDGSLYVGMNLSSATISPDGEWEIV